MYTQRGGEGSAAIVQGTTPSVVVLPFMLTCCTPNLMTLSLLQHTGHVSPEEIRKILHADPTMNLTEEDIKDIVRACDRDGDGQLNWEEVVAAMKH